MSITVVLDTNIYSGNKFRLGQDFQTLGSLCKSGKVELVLPYIVKREFETQLDAEATELVVTFEKAGKRLAATPIPSDLRGELDALLAKLKARKQETIGSHSAEFAVWRTATGAVDLALSGDHALAAMDSYFKGGAPFGSIKSRGDIPDAMIYQAVASVAANHEVAFVSNDKKLTAAMNGIQGVACYKDLNSFIASDEIRAIIAEQDSAQYAVDVLAALESLASNLPNPLDSYVAEHGGERLAGTSFSSASIPSDDREAYIDMYGNLESIEFDWSEASYHGDSIFVVPFSGEGDFSISYFVPNWEIEGLAARGATYSSHNDYVVEAEESAVLCVSGTLLIKVASDFAQSDTPEDAIESMAIDSVNDPILCEDAEDSTWP